MWCERYAEDLSNFTPGSWTFLLHASLCIHCIQFSLYIHALQWQDICSKDGRLVVEGCDEACCLFQSSIHFPYLLYPWQRRGRLSSSQHALGERQGTSSSSIFVAPGEILFAIGLKQTYLWKTHLCLVEDGAARVEMCSSGLFVFVFSPCVSKMWH